MFGGNEIGERWHRLTRLEYVYVMALASSLLSATPFRSCSACLAARAAL
jgi:hypothetical protein